MSSKCDKALANIYPYLDRELNWWRRRQIRKHVADCSPCEVMVSFEERFLTVVRNKLTDECPPEILDRLRSAIHNEATPPG